MSAQAFGDGVRGPFEDHLVSVVKDYTHTGLEQDLGDATAHGTSADDSDVVDGQMLSCHDGLDV